MASSVLTSASNAQADSATKLIDSIIKSPYPEIPGLPDAYQLFHLGQGGLPAWKREQAITAARKHHTGTTWNYIEKPLTSSSDFEGNYGSYLDTQVKNTGDAFKDDGLSANSKFMERAVLDYYAQLWNAKWPHSDNDPESYWGFCLDKGSTEGNLYGMWLARDYLSGKKMVVDDRLVDGPGGVMVKAPQLVIQKPIVDPTQSENAYTPIAFYSEEEAETVARTMAMLGTVSFHVEGSEKYPGQCPITDNREWPVTHSYDMCTLNINKLAAAVDFFAARGYPILLYLTYGATSKGAYDDVASACEKLEPVFLKHGLLKREVKFDDQGETKVEERTGYWIHVDAAHGAAHMPYIEMAYNAGKIPEKGPSFDFSLPMVQSIAMSGDKGIGPQLPGGVFMTKTKNRMIPSDMPESIATRDTTFAGASRNGLTPMLLWDTIARNSKEDQMQKSLNLEELAAYLESRLRRLQDEVLQEDLYVERLQFGLTVLFKRANDELYKKYSLVNVDLLDGRRYSQVNVTERVTRELVDALIEDLSQEGAFAT